MVESVVPVRFPVVRRARQLATAQSIDQGVMVVGDGQLTASDQQDQIQMLHSVMGERVQPLPGAHLPMIMSGSMINVGQKNVTSCFGVSPFQVVLVDARSMRVRGVLENDVQNFRLRLIDRIAIVDANMKLFVWFLGLQKGMKVRKIYLEKLS